MREGLQRIEAKGACTALDRMNRAEDGVDRLTVLLPVLEGDEAPFGSGKTFLALKEENLLDFVKLHDVSPPLRWPPVQGRGGWKGR